MSASYSLQDFVGDGVLKDILDKLEGDGWDDVPTLKMMSSSDMEALQLADSQRDALELRTYLHDRNLMQYADKLESGHKPLVELLNTNPSVLASEYGMRRGHVARFVDRSTACGIQLPPNLSLPARKRTFAPRDGESEYGSFVSYQSAATDASPPPSSIRSAASSHRRRMSYDQMSFESRQSVQSGPNVYDSNETIKKEVHQERPKAAVAAPAATSVPIKGIVAKAPATPRFCGLMAPVQVADDVTPLSVLEKIYVQKLTPEHKKGTDPWRGGELKIPPPIKVSELWVSKPTILMCLRRPGCVMCRAEAHQIYARKPIFDAMGVQLVAVLNEYIDAEVRAFWPRYWGGVVVVDRNRDLFKALGGGKLLKDNLVTGFVFNSQARRNWKRATATGFEYNLNGQGHIKGGLYIVGPGKAGVAYQFMERNFGDWAPLEEVLNVCTKLQESISNERANGVASGENNKGQREGF